MVVILLAFRDMPISAERFGCPDVGLYHGSRHIGPRRVGFAGDIRYGDDVRLPPLVSIVHGRTSVRCCS